MWNNTSQMCENDVTWKNWCMLGWQSPWEGANPTKEMRGNDKNTNARWAPLTPNTGANHPHMVATLGSALCNPWTPTRLQPSTVPETQTRHPKTTTQGLPKRWRSPDWVDMATVTHVNRVLPKLQSQRQSDCGWQLQR